MRLKNNTLNINIMGLLAVIVLLVTITAVVYEGYTIYKFFKEITKSNKDVAEAEKELGSDVTKETSTE